MVPRFIWLGAKISMAGGTCPRVNTPCLALLSASSVWESWDGQHVLRAAPSSAQTRITYPSRHLPPPKVQGSTRQDFSWKCIPNEASFHLPFQRKDSKESSAVHPHVREIGSWVLDSTWMVHGIPTLRVRKSLFYWAHWSSGNHIICCSKLSLLALDYGIPKLNTIQWQIFCSSCWIRLSISLCSYVFHIICGRTFENLCRTFAC